MDKQTRKALKHIAPGDKVLYFGSHYNGHEWVINPKSPIELMVRRSLKFRGCDVLIVYDLKRDLGPRPGGLYFGEKDCEYLRKQIPDLDVKRYVFLRATSVFLSFPKFTGSVPVAFQV